MKRSQDMDTVFSQKQQKLAELIKKVKLDSEQKKLVVIAMQFSYAAAFCQKTLDIQGSFSEAYREGFDKMESLLQ